MDIRKDFESVAPYIYRLAQIGNSFAEHNIQDWSHLKGREDFKDVYTLQQPRRLQFEELYAKGRDCAIGMSTLLSEFNNVSRCPTLSSYIDSLENSWANQIEPLQQFIYETKALAVTEGQSPWAVHSMIELFEDQLHLLNAVKNTISIIKQSHLYKLEKGEETMEKESSIKINNIFGKVNINSTDNSINIEISAMSIFASLCDAIKKSDIEIQSKNNLVQSIEAMEDSVGSPGFAAKYKDFIQNAANHMSVISPFIPALTSLLS